MYQRRVMATQFVQSEELPNLLDMSGSPPTKRAMQFWRYVHRWRQRLFQRWGEAQSPELAPGLRGQLVDHLIGLGLILEYLRRERQIGVPTIQETCKAASQVDTDRLCHELQRGVHDRD